YQPNQRYHPVHRAKTGEDGEKVPRKRYLSLSPLLLTIQPLAGAGPGGRPRDCGNDSVRLPLRPGSGGVVSLPPVASDVLPGPAEIFSPIALVVYRWIHPPVELPVLPH